MRHGSIALLVLACATGCDGAGREVASSTPGSGGTPPVSEAPTVAATPPSGATPPVGGGPSYPSAPSITLTNATSIPDCQPSWRALAVHRPAVVVRVVSPFAPTRPFIASHGQTIPAHTIAVETLRSFGGEYGPGGAPRSLDRRGDMPMDRFTRGVAPIAPFDAVDHTVRAAVGGELIVLLAWTEGTTRGVCLLDGCVLPASVAMEAAVAGEIADQAAEQAREPAVDAAVTSAIESLARPPGALDAMRALLAMGPRAMPHLARRIGDTRSTGVGVLDLGGPAPRPAMRHSVGTVGAAAIAMLEAQTGLACPCEADARRGGLEPDRCASCWRVVAAKAVRAAGGQAVSRCVSR